jgi:NAD(P)-dependent dehydrogenase (short-subunit alcohol dehydrogenase family)
MENPNLIDAFDTGTLFHAIPARYPELNGKVAVVTGGSKGIGKGIAIRLAREGMKVIINSRHLDEAKKTASELHAVGVEALAVAGDIGNNDDIQHLFDETLRAYGRVDLLVNNAANLHRVPFFDVSESMFASELDTNIKGPFLCSYRAAQMMKEIGGGSIVHISSVGGLRAHYPGLPYDATKGALDAMTGVMGIELIQFGIRVNGIAPGAIYTEHRLPMDHPKLIPYNQLIPSNRMGMPLEIGAAVAFLSSDDAAYIVGQTIYVDGGVTAQLSPQQYPI